MPRCGPILVRLLRLGMPPLHRQSPERRYDAELVVPPRPFMSLPSASSLPIRVVGRTMPQTRQPPPRELAPIIPPTGGKFHTAHNPRCSARQHCRLAVPSRGASEGDFKLAQPQAVRWFCDDAEAVVPLSATPIQLGDPDLYALLHLLRPDQLPSRREHEQSQLERPRRHRMRTPHGPALDPCTQSWRHRGNERQKYLRAPSDLPHRPDRISVRILLDDFWADVRRLTDD